MSENINKEIRDEDVRAEEAKDTVSKLFEDRDSEDRDRSKIEESGEANLPGKLQNPDTPSKKSPGKLKEENVDVRRPSANDQPLVDSSEKEKILNKEDEDKTPPELEALRKKLEKTEKTLAENHRYGRSNAQKVKNAMKAVQRFVDDGLLAEEEAKELLQTLHSEGEEIEEDTHRHQTNPFAPIFKVANKELQNILKYTDDPHLQDKVNAFDYFLSVGSKEEIEQVFEDLSDLLDDPLKLARKMLSIGQDVYEESYKGIKESGGFKNYLSKKDQEIEKLQKKLDKLERKLLQYEDFDKPRYRIDETGSPGGDVEGSKPANDTISALFDERDKVKRK